MFNRLGTCIECKERHKEVSKYEWLAELKFNIWLYRHYKKEHNANIIIKILRRQK